MRSLHLLALVLFLAAGAPANAETPLAVHVRVEGAWDTLWEGEVDASGYVAFTAYNSGGTHTIEAHTPLGVLLRAAEAGGFEVLVTDAWVPGGDFTVDQVAEERWAGAIWWDYRVNLVQTYYGAHFGWLEHGPGLAAGDRVLWYPEATGSRPLRLTAQTTDEGIPGGVAAFAAEWAIVDPPHQPGRSWPTQVWTAAHAARIVGDVTADAPLGLTVVALAPGAYAVKATVAAGLYPAPIVRTETVTLVVA